MAAMQPRMENRMSFAKVAASAGKGNESAPVATFAKVGAMKSSQDSPTTESSGSSRNNTSGHAVSTDASSATRTPLFNVEQNLADAMKSVSLKPSLVVNGSGTLDSNRREVFGDASPDDLFQRTDSGSDVGTKPPSLDGKSITSGTTFALDEKESLRPDDSASVKAAEDDDTFSGRGSIVAGSRIGSEAAARAYRAQTYEITDRRIVLLNLEPQPQGTMTPDSGSSGPPTRGELGHKPLTGPSGTPEGFNLFYKHSPDEKLLEALDSPKDRIFLLRLEQDVIEFVKDSKEPFIDLPPSNSFCRMLTHKLADYYHMTHQFDPVTGSVRIFRTPFCRLPQSLTSISNPPTSGNTPPPTMPTMKIMRRGGDNAGTPSKPTSETGSDGKDKSLSAKEKLSREEREAAYNKARERIFGSVEKSGDATPDAEDDNGMSRSSSVSGKGKRSKTTKKHRTDSESFDVRSQYTPFFPPQQQQSWPPIPQYAPVGVPQYGGNMQNSYPGVPGQQYGPPPSQQFHPGMMVGATGMPPYHQMSQSQFQRPNPPNFQPHNAQMGSFGPPIQTPPQQPQQPVAWGVPLPYQAYQSRGGLMPSSMPNSMANSMPNSQTIPYPYGQLPSTVNPADPKSQHPIPGSFNRHAFNPKTQSFVPGNSGAAIPQAMSHHGSPHPPYNGFNTPPQYGNNMGYNMSRQSSNASVPSYHASPHIAPRSMIHQGINPGGPPSGPNGSHLPHFGNLSSLPPKPPPAI